MTSRRPSITGDLNASDATAMHHGLDSNRSRTMTMAAGDVGEERLDTLGTSSSHGSASTSAKSGLSQATLAAASLQLLAVLCCTPSHTAIAKNCGIVRSMLSAYTAHGSSGDVFAAFADLVEGVITEDEVAAAIAAVEAATLQLRTLANDESLFAIEDKELAGEGVLLFPGDSSSSKSKSGKVAAKALSAPKESRATAMSIGVALTEHLCLLETACCR